MISEFSAPESTRYNCLLKFAMLLSSSSLFSVAFAVLFVPQFSWKSLKSFVLPKGKKPPLVFPLPISMRNVVYLRDSGTIPRWERRASCITSTTSTFRSESFILKRNESTRFITQLVLLSFSPCDFTPLLITVKTLLEGILYSLVAFVYRLYRASSVAWKVGSVKDIKSVLIAVSFNTLKAPLLCAFFPSSTTLIFTPFEPTSIPVKMEELLNFDFRFPWADKVEYPAISIRNINSLRV